MPGDKKWKEEDLGTGDPRCPLVLLLDTSDSMGWPRASENGKSLPVAIDQLNEGLQTLKGAISADQVAKRRIEILVVTFGGSVSPRGNFELARDWEVPRLTASGGTPMGEAILTGLRLVNERRRELQLTGTLTYRPWVFLLTDGAPTDDVSKVPGRIADAERDKHAIFWSVAVKGADVSVLKSFRPEAPVLLLDETNWASIFTWLSAAVSRVARSRPNEQIAVDPWTLTT